MARLGKRPSARGIKYLTGRWCSARFTLKKTSETAEEDNPVSALKLSEALPYQPIEGTHHAKQSDRSRG